MVNATTTGLILVIMFAVFFMFTQGMQTYLLFKLVRGRLLGTGGYNEPREKSLADFKLRGKDTELSMIQPEQTQATTLPQMPTPEADATELFVKEQNAAEEMKRKRVEAMNRDKKMKQLERLKEQEEKLLRDLDN